MQAIFKNFILPKHLQDVKSPEGISISEYNWLKFIAISPLSFAVHFYSQWVKKTSKTIQCPGLFETPDNAIFMTFHNEAFIDICIPELNDFMEKENVHWMGHHGIFSYLGSMTSFLFGIKAFRYHHGTKTKPRDQLKSFLSRYQGRFLLRTDSGGPYGKVRKSIVHMALQHDRPIIATRYRASKTLTIWGHRFPLPGCRFQVAMSKPIEPKTLAAMSVEAARDYLQEAIDTLAFPKSKQQKRLIY